MAATHFEVALTTNGDLRAVTVTATGGQDKGLARDAATPIVKVSADSAEAAKTAYVAGLIERFGIKRTDAELTKLVKRSL